MPTVTVKLTFVGSPEEVAKYGGEPPAEYKSRKSKMSEGELNSFKGVITVGTKMEVSDKRKKELEDLGLIEGKSLKEKEAEEKEKQATETQKEKKDLTMSTEKNFNAGPNPVKEHLNIKDSTGKTNVGKGKINKR